MIPRRSGIAAEGRRDVEEGPTYARVSIPGAAPRWEGVADQCLHPTIHLHICVRYRCEEVTAIRMHRPLRNLAILLRMRCARLGGVVPWSLLAPPFSVLRATKEFSLLLHKVLEFTSW